ncbi:NADH-quinone oxidoreductase subunit L [Oceanospirillum sanctuarii]|uniref:NADH-quinone oxidoreductase subunit L n=1 Tax=Oceanospirillum sanctuarii TaxID=1434821 RepID=UPI000A38FEDD|nr:NADH-quinone oxidoreductase subunit L [Oceanospirillum sanctuarii]
MSSTFLSSLLSGWLLPVIFFTAFLLSLYRPERAWCIAKISARTGLIAAAVTLTATLTGLLVFNLTADLLSVTLMQLVALLGWVITGFARRYLQGESPQQHARFVQGMLFTLTSVGLLITSQHLLLIALAWAGTSFGLHHLLTHYKERKAAQIVAHKKFIVSRLAEIAMVIALVLIYQTAGTLSLPQLNAFIADQPALPVALHWAAALFALAAILKTAQLPLHGWLIQVMEAPTPVSALLHAGVVNMGGFVLIRLAELISLAPVAQAMLVIVGSLTAVLAGLVMMTRISIKVRLAWSTCAQMGFMLMEIGLGLYELALLHLLAHSLYKAYAFLSSGETVAQSRIGDFFSKDKKRHVLLSTLFSPLLTLAVVSASVMLWQQFAPGLHLSPVVTLILVLGLTPLFWQEKGLSLSAFITGAVRVALLTQLYLIWHLLFAQLAPAAGIASQTLMVWVAISFITLYGLQTWIRLWPEGRVSRRLFPWAFNGFYLDETFTRLTFKYWPARLSPLQAETRFNRRNSGSRKGSITTDSAITGEQS